MIDNFRTKSNGRRTTTDEVVDYISDRIRKGEYKIGDKLPNEDELSKAIGVGRSSIREGMKVLKVYGVVEIRQGGGTFVTDNVAENMFNFLWFISGSTNENFLDFRRTLEVGSVICNISKYTENDYDELQFLIDKMNPNNDLDELVIADRDFHHKLTCLGNNPLEEQIDRLLYQIRTDTLYKSLCHEEDAEITHDAHQRILDAIKSKNIDECINAILDHLDTSSINISR